MGFPGEEEAKHFPWTYSGTALCDRNSLCGQYLHRFNDVVPLPIKQQTGEEKREARAKKKAERAAVRLAKHSTKWDPKKNEKATSDAYKTLFVGRLAFDVTEVAHVQRPSSYWGIVG